ncbi:MAG: hypothetical protein IPL61_03945 [Myxococcales bacterium]|nr:hypothetical protein [Myxococcales bacterium]
MTTSPRTGLPMARGAAPARIDALDDLLARAAAPTPTPPPARARAAEEPADPEEVLRDYVLAPYPPLADPRGGLTARNLLTESLALAGVEAEGHAVIERLRALLGRGRVVWGVKHAAGALSWELYIYDPGGARAEATPAHVLGVLADLLTPPPLPPGPIAHHMWSLELDRAALATGRGARVTYYVNGADTPGASRSYAVDERGQLALANLYTFHDPRRAPRAILARLRASVHLGAAPHGVAAVIAPGLHRCRRLCVANKRHADGLYFAGVDTDLTVQFLARHGWPAPLVAYVDARRARLAHLAWDLGLDVHAGADGAPVIARTAVHATC